MTTYDFPSGIPILRQGFCDTTTNDDVFKATRGGGLPVTRRGPVLWKQEFSVITWGAKERAMKAFLANMDGMVNTCRAPDFFYSAEEATISPQPELIPFFDELFFITDFEDGSPLAILMLGDHDRGETTIAVNANQSRVKLLTGHRVQIGNGLHYLTSDAELDADGTGDLEIYPPLRKDTTSGAAIIASAAKGLWKIKEVSRPQFVSRGYYRRDFSLVEDIRAVRA
ncbi:hypothetical protein FF098_014870 [Parvularcula flava]|uniref:Uncharacterized protein n=1 Tax=Aquisalinus luteolus TaxID=1566827 RepID=A0A8J3EVB2_9PROT|nr:hypothetical protein [Aquisalinus luteolus]NHK29201.1 hypothetical protein [Aquisalinus luteolus]GGH99993.1 hypothetical protein GCM10011355_27240 [Aquisalinus luteolus]